ncbi:CBS domain-containing protein [Rhizobiaceae bacterium]|nr:CBS domain-containing protein [Rhizobiaceae bacterium]
MKISERAEYRSKPRPLSFPETATVAEAVAGMSSRNYGAVIVNGSDDRMSGLFTERDVMKRIVDKGLDPKSTKLADVMTRDVRVAKAEDEVHDWLRIMSNERFRRLPVVDEAGKVIAIMTQGDFVSYTWPDIVSQARDAARESIPRNYQIYLIGGAVLIYSLILVLLLNN